VATDPPQPEQGDFAVSVAFRLARLLRQSPLQVAERLASMVELDPEFARLEVAAPGYLNFSLRPTWLRAQLPQIEAAGPDFGRTSLGAGVSLQVEFVSSNPTGPLMFHSARGGVIGDVLARILSFAGFRVQREYLVNDGGTQVGLFALSILARLRNEPLPEGGYPGAYVGEIAEAIRTSWPAGRWQRPDEAVVGEVADFGIEWVLRTHREDLERIDIHHDHWFSEQRCLYASGYADETMARLRALGCVTEHDGAVWFRGPSGEEAVLYRRTGAATYFATDVFYHRDKLERRGFDRVIDVLGADHQHQVQRLPEALAVLGLAPERVHFLVFQLVTIRRDGRMVRSSRRRGDATLLREMVDEVGADGIRYFFLRRSADVAIEFDVELAKQQSNENPVYYAQYAHARLSNVLAFARSRPGGDDLPLERLETEWELDLMRHLARWPDVAHNAARDVAPHRLPFYADGLASRIHLFYNNCRVVTDDVGLTAARLQLVRSARVTLANVLRLIGVATPDRM
jgi:arginyl-tRNA synthetase